MFLKKLEISGFKSFANKTSLDFSSTSASLGRDGISHDGVRGITAVVGPNGSGKSNIADALRWVMGEQSMKNLRGKKSDDIIFAGSGKKARLGSAQVTLYFDNADKKIPLEFDEVSITRKIYRSGEGEYLVNGSRVRLQDVVDILAKAGIGKESYSIINQGMADAVLNATPLDRRSIIEEAAGVKQYQIKKERSLRKLDSTRENLDKARSLAEEIKPHLKMLKRQAEKASQSEGVIKELREKQLILCTYLWNNFQQEKNTFNQTKEEMGRTMMNMQRDVDKLADELNREAKVDEVNVALSELEKQKNEKRNQLNQLDRDLIVTEGRIEIEKEKQKNIEMIEEIKVQSIPVDLHYVRKGIEDIRAEQEKLIAQIENAESIDDLQDIKEFARSIQQRLFELKADIENGKKEDKINVDTRQCLVSTKESVEKIDSTAIIEFKEKTIKLREDIAKIEIEIKDIEQKIEAEIQADRQKRQKFFEVERSFRAKQEELNKLKDQFNDSKVALARVEVHEEDLRETVLKELNLNVEELKQEISQIDRGQLERDITRLKGQMEQIGGIDPLVVEEYEETNKRFEFLTKESEDLENAIVSLREIIKEMDQKINGEFSATFEEINKEFTKYFRIIFGGGNASLKKVEVRKRAYKSKDEVEGGVEEGEELPIETEEERREKSDIGIDISASPPGKKISNLSMLSGGERSLTSLALLFAIIAHNPPPFAVLDEVEAALDEANSKRFGRIIQELSGSTQFVTITHNRETMRQASVLYGVTMGDEGISKLLSVRLDQVGQGGRILQ
ncbi:MAG: Chromosome partition protein Smc [Candidatus Moranbacteria bacterium GW2011_GWA2_39_41]|nr:MAG: Chromosome partition protein Smc [Candidatus Moranbacteria bacterium GW2011_GWA2_39_41]